MDREELDGNQLKAEVGGISVTVRGGMLVIIVSLLLGNAGLTVWMLDVHMGMYHQLTAHLDAQDKSAQLIRDDSTAMRAVMSTEHGGQTSEIRENRMYLREIERLCLLTPEQRLKMQSKLTPAMRELLLQGVQP